MSQQAFLMSSDSTDQVYGTPPPDSALERDFPNGQVSIAAQAESWRKEIHRPASHTHKWWAQRLGTVFRSVLVAAYSKNSDEVLHRLSNGFDLRGIRVLDPFAGSGTTLVEAQKLGASCTGVDINPVAGLVQRQALRRWNEDALIQMMSEVEMACRSKIDALHIDRHGNPVLYYFWVAQARCPICADQVDLFSDYVFAKHAYPRQHPEARAVCPECNAVEQVNLNHESRGHCRNGHGLDVLAPVKRDSVTCGNRHVTRIIDALDGQCPEYRMYAKLTWRDNQKHYEPIDQYDLDLFSYSAELLHASRDKIVLPDGVLDDGYNTRQAIRWGFNSWDKFFNSRQLYCLGLLGAAVRDLRESPEREALCTLFSGTLEFNNLFCSYKGEGTGAVRHMFSNHVLKPERTPLEAHPWGTPKSSGSFSTLFRSRILRAHKYKSAPHDIVVSNTTTTRRAGISRPLDSSIQWEAIVCDASSLVHDDETFDIIVTDPPYFNNVHYSELADFFHAWLKQIRPYREYQAELCSTRSNLEVQNTDVALFGDALARVFKEGARVLKREGMMVFSFHHGTTEAWLAVCRALMDSGFSVTSIQPVKAEMSTSSTKSGARHPNNLDSLVVCRPTEDLVRGNQHLATTPHQAARQAEERLASLGRHGISVGTGDVRSVVSGSVLALTTHPNIALSHDQICASAVEFAEDACRRWSEQHACHFASGVSA